MKRQRLYPGVIIALCLMCIPFSSASAADENPLKAGDGLPRIILAAPQDPAHQEYLGVSGTETFSIGDIEADAVIIEIFSMYCPHCQKEAPAVNRFYASLQADAALKDRVKLIGIGVGNSEFEVDVFRKKYDIPFPLFPDADFTIHKQAGEVRTPFFIGVKTESGGAGRVVYAKPGGLDGGAELMKAVRRALDGR